MNIIIAIAVIAFFPVGLKFISEEGMILAAFGRLMKRVEKAPVWLRKPLWTCERCMCSIWGLPAAYAVISLPLYYTWPMIAITAVGVQLLVEP